MIISFSIDQIHTSLILDDLKYLQPSSGIIIEALTSTADDVSIQRRDLFEKRIQVVKDRIIEIIRDIINFGKKHLERAKSEVIEMFDVAKIEFGKDYELAKNIIGEYISKMWEKYISTVISFCPVTISYGSNKYRPNGFNISYEMKIAAELSTSIVDLLKFIVEGKLSINMNYIRGIPEEGA